MHTKNTLEVWRTRRFENLPKLLPDRKGIRQNVIREMYCSPSKPLTPVRFYNLRFDL